MANSDLARIIKRIKDLEVRVKFLSRKDGERSHKHKELTIASGEIDVQERDYYFLHPESSTTDELDTINGGQDGFVVALQIASSGDTITLKDGTGNLQLNGDLELSTVFDVAYLIYRETDTVWCQIGFNHSTGGGIDADTLQGHPASDFVLVADLFDDDEGNPVDVGTTADGISVFAARRDHSHALADNAVTTTKILDGNVTYAKIQNVTADRVLGSVLGGAVEEIVLTSFGRLLIDDADAATARTTLGLGTIATQPETDYALLAGRSGGQHLKGGTNSGNNLTLESTNHATKGKILFGTSAYDEVNNRLGVGLTTPTDTLHVSGGGLYLINPVNDYVAIRIRPADGNKISRIQAIGDGNVAHSAVVFSQILPTGAGNPTDGKLEFQTMDAGVLATRMTILDSGNVGIGTTSPATRLNVVGTTATLRFGTAGEVDSSAFWIDVATSGGSTNSGHGRTLVVKAGDTDNSAGRIGGALYLRGGTPTSPATTYGKVVINDAGGFVGIGTDEPQSKFHGYDGEVGFGVFYASDIVGSVKTIIAGGVGDVTQTIYISGYYRTTDGSVMGTLGQLISNGATSIVGIPGTDAITFEVAGGGDLSVSRTSGTKTWEVTFWAIWR